MPIDPVSDGTWIAVNDAGLAAALLNVNLGPGNGGTKESPTLSRGTILPKLMLCSTLAEAKRVCVAIDPRQYPPFQLAVIDDRRIEQFRSDGTALRNDCMRLDDRAYMFTSSGLGDAFVEQPRRELFDQIMAPNGDRIAQQDAFHRHSWPDRRHLSVCMERAEARTVSHTVIDIEPDRVVLTYVPDAPDRAQPLAPIELVRPGASP